MCNLNTDADTAFKSWTIQNSIKDISDNDDDLFLKRAAIYEFHPETHAQLVEEKAWKNDPHYFKNVWISALALIKMVIHARSGGRFEIMGLMQGKIIGDSFLVMDAFALPVQGTETRVNAGAEANEYMISYQEASEKVSRKEQIVGWYHSHPGYGCWLSGIDVQTEAMYQQYQDPFIAVVIDPTRTCAAGRVELKAFRCYSEDYIPPDTEHEGFQVIPANKIEDFGLHWRRYYSLPVQVFKSKLDESILTTLWNSHWSLTLLSNSFTESSQFHLGLIEDLRIKLEQLESRTEKHLRRQKCKLKNLLNDFKECSIQSKEAASEKLQFLSTLVLTLATFTPPNQSTEILSNIIMQKRKCVKNSSPFP